ncbi:MAG: hypothetical protein ACP5HQ_01565 [Thermoprotei archaeon]
MRSELLVGLLVVTLVANVILGIELYNALYHPVTLGSNPNATATQGNVTTATLISKQVGANETATATSTATTAVVTTPGTSRERSYNFTFQADLEVGRSGSYEVSSHFAYPGEIVVITFPDGTVVTLTAQNPASTVYLKKGEYSITIYVSFVSDRGVSQDQVWDSLHLKFVLQHGHEAEDSD